MMDIALLTANANQLRFLITYNSEEKTFIISAALIILSLFVQVAVGIGMIYKVCALKSSFENGIFNAVRLYFSAK